MKWNADNASRQIFAVFLIFAAWHSLLASRRSKQAAVRLFGDHARNGLYRFGYNALSVVFVVPVTIWLARLPDRPLYRVPPPFSWALRLVQIASMALAVDAARRVGLPKITGLGLARQWVEAKSPPPEPEAQGPVLASPAQMDVSGAFRLSRHPLNLAPIGIFWCFPLMTRNRALVAALSTAYLILGSAHEEIRLRAAYGKPYEAYQRSDVPFYFPIRWRG